MEFSAIQNGGKLHVRKSGGPQKSGEPQPRRRRGRRPSRLLSCNPRRPCPWFCCLFRVVLGIRRHAAHRSSKCHNCAGPRIPPVLACPGGKDLHSPDFFDKLTGRHPLGWRPAAYPFFQLASLTPAQMLRYTAGSTRPSGRSGPHGCRAR